MCSKSFVCFVNLLINSIEKVGDNRYLIGFSCGNQFVITPKIAFKVRLLLNKIFI